MWFRTWVLVVISLISLNSCSVAANSKTEELVTKVIVTKSGHRIYKLTFDQVEEQLTLAARVSVMEGQWIYVVEDETLYDVSQGNTLTAVRVNFLRFKSDKNPTGIDIAGKNVIDIHIHTWRSYGARSFLPPSSADLHSHVSHEVPEYLKLGAKSVRVMVFDGHGLWEFTMTPKFASAIERCGGNEMLDKFNSLYDPHAIRNDTIEERTRVVERHIERCKRLGLFVTYKSEETR